jgi:hypothetical protein
VSHAWTLLIVIVVSSRIRSFTCLSLNSATWDLCHRVEVIWASRRLLANSVDNSRDKPKWHLGQRSNPSRAATTMLLFGRKIAHSNKATTASSITGFSLVCCLHNILRAGMGCLYQLHAWLHTMEKDYNTNIIYSFIAQGIFYLFLEYNSKEIKR